MAPPAVPEEEIWIYEAFAVLSDFRQGGGMGGCQPLTYESVDRYFSRFYPGMSRAAYQDALRVIRKLDAAMLQYLAKKKPTGASSEGP